MRLDLYGGFGEKGRTCLGVESAGFRLLLDAGVKTSAHGRDDYYPAIGPDELSVIDAIIVTHAHEDHLAALGWCIAGGFRGRIFMTAETQREGRCVPRELLRPPTSTPAPARQPSSD
jgi:predicted metal-dependent RNase